MIKKNRKMLIITSITILLPILIGVILWRQLPESIPNHWNISGEIDGWSKKAFAVFGQPLIMLLLHWVTVFACLSDPKRKNHSKQVLQLILWLIPTVNAAITAFSYSAAIGKNLPVVTFATAMVGMLFIAIGNYLPKCRQNYTFGIKLPWTLHSEENWNKTHRVTGWIMVIGGIAIIVTGLLNMLWVMLAVFAIMVLTPLVYSYVLHRQGI